MKINVKTLISQDIKSLKNSVWPAIDSMRQEEEIETLQKRDDWLQSIENRVLLLHFKQPAKSRPQTHDAQTISFYGTLLYLKQSDAN